MDGIVAQALLVSALVIVIGFLGNALFERTGLPDMLFLIVLGYVVGPLLRLFDPSSVTALAPYLAALALVFILFDGGMHMNIRQVISDSPRAVLLAVLGFSVSLLITAAFMTYLVGVPLLHGILFGSILGGSSSIVVVSLARRINVSEKCSTTLTLESAITDILCIVVSLVVIGIILTGQLDYYVVAKDIAARFLIGSFIGIALGLVWWLLLKRLVKQPFSYMLTLAVVLFGYTISEYFGGSGALSSLLFGLVLGNEMGILKALKRERVDDIAVDGGLRRFESEIAFLIRTFFFVFLGLIATISDLWFILVGALVSLMLLLARFGVVTLVTLRSELKSERPIMSVVLTRGLAAAVLATLPLQYANPEIYPDVGPVFQFLSPLYINLAVTVIVSTAIITTLGAFALRFAKGKG